MPDKMKKGILIVGILILIVTQTYPAIGTLIEVSITTNKSVYSLEEDIRLSVTVFNPNDYELPLLGFGGSYRIDDGYWLPLGGIITLPPMSIEPFGSHITNFTYRRSRPGDNPDAYPILEVGVHSVVGKASVETGSYIQSAPVQFSVTPEPATLLLLGMGGLAIRKFKSKS